MDFVTALELRGHCAQGQTVPLYLSCRVGTQEAVYQTKLSGKRSGLSARELGVELMGTILGREFGLHVARPALVVLPPSILEEIEGEYAFGVNDRSAFGSLWKAETTPFVPEVEIERLDETMCARLMALDLVLTNGDRTEPNPNVCWDDEGLLVFDFEHCLELPRTSHARRLALHLESLDPLYETHLVCPRVSAATLRRETANFLASLNVERLERVSFALPHSWQEVWCDNVGYLRYIKSEPEGFLDRVGELTR